VIDNMNLACQGRIGSGVLVESSWRIVSALERLDYVGGLLRANQLLTFTRSQNAVPLSLPSENQLHSKSSQTSFNVNNSTIML
jgi:hypothetical protein